MRRARKLGWFAALVPACASAWRKIGILHNVGQSLLHRRWLWASKNQLTDHLSKLGSSRIVIPLGVLIQDLLAPSIKEEKEIQEVPPAKQLVLTVPLSDTDWREQFIKYLSSAEVPADKTKTERLIRRSKHYVLVDGNLMRKSAKEGILQKCITQEDGVKLLLEIHSGSYGNHAASRTLVGKAF